MAERVTAGLLLAELENVPLPSVFAAETVPAAFVGVRFDVIGVLADFLCAFDFFPLHTGCATVHDNMSTPGVAGKSTLILDGQLKILSNLGVYESIATDEFFVVVYAFFKLSYSGYGVNTHGTVSWSQFSGRKYPIPNLPGSEVFSSAALREHTQHERHTRLQ